MISRTLLALGASFAALTATPALARPMTPEDLATIPRVAAPVASPDGRWVVFQRTDTDPASYARTTGLWIVPSTGGEPRRIADIDGASESSPAFSADGRRLYFTSAKSGKSQLWFVAFDGAGNAMGAPVQASDTMADVDGFRLAPDGRQVVMWGSIRQDCPTFGCAADTTPRGSGRLYNDGEGFVRHWDSWKEPGTFNRAFSFALGEDGRVAGDARALMPEVRGNTPSAPFGGAEEITWSPDSRTVYLTRRVTDRGEARSTNLDIYSVAAGGGAGTNLTANNQATDTLPTPSPDGRWLAWAAMSRPSYEADRQVLMLRDLRTGAVRALTQGWDRSVASIAWAPDSRSLIVTAQDTLEHPAFRVDARTGRVTRLTQRGNIGDVTVMRDGRILASRNDITAPTELVTLPARGGAPMTLTRVTDAARSGLDGFDYRQFSFPGAGGETVWGQIIAPQGTAGRPLPTILMIHGGPQGSFGNSWSTRWNPATWAAQGMAVVTIDFHGSTGYGQAFTDSINRDWGGKPLEDLRLGLAAAARLDPRVQPNNACAAGGSYGGYMVNWIAGNWSDQFKCLINHAGVFDLRAMAYETEEQWFDEWDHGGPWYQRENAERWNPVNYVRNWRTPMLVIHGEKDFRIPYSQGLASWSAAQRRDVPAQLLIFPDENHWILKGRNSVQWHRTVFDWVRRWTGAENLMPAPAPTTGTTTGE